jgi:hypothetical protein
MALLNQFAVGESYLSLCVELTGVILSSSGLVFDARRLTACRPEPRSSIEKTGARRKALIAKGFGIILRSDLAWRP